MTISSLSSSMTLNSLLSSSTSSTSSKYSQLKTVVDGAIAAGDSTAPTLYKSLVTLSSADSSTDSTDSTTSETYTAKGLLSAINSAQLANNPLLQSAETTNSSLFGTSADNSTLSALYQQIQESGE